MMLMEHIRISRFLVLLVICFSQIGCSTEDVKVYYIPFRILTSVPVTQKDIEKRAHYKGSINDKSSIEKIKKVIKQCVPGKFDESMVRAEVKFSNEVYFFDAFGGMFNGSKSSKVDSVAIEKEFERIFKIK
jgi:hypothetical protein